jgi:hypothetical protein
VVHCNEQDRQCIYNVTLRGVRAPLMQWKGSITHSACVSGAFVLGMQNVCAVFHFHLWPLHLNKIYLHYFINGTIFEEKKKKKKVTGCKMGVSIFSTNLSETFPILRIIQQDIVINVHQSR